MAEVTNDMLLQEVLAVEARLGSIRRELSETLTIARETNRVLAEGRKRIEIAKHRYRFADNQACFGGRHG